MSDDGAMFGNVIVGVDGRQGGRDAIALARLLLAPGGRLALANACSGFVPPAGAWVEASQSAAVMAEGVGPVAQRDLPAMATIERTESEELLQRERAATGIDAELISTGPDSAGRALHELAEQQDADLLVVGSCHRGLLGRVLIGNDTLASLNGCNCAIAIAALDFESDRFRTIGVGYDGSPESKAALAVARDLAQRHGASVEACETVQLVPFSYSPLGGVALSAALQGMLAEADMRLSALEGVTGEAVIGSSGEELAAFSGRLDLLVVGSRGYGPLRRLIFGSTSHYLAGHARCSLLVLPRGVGVDTATRFS